MCDVQEVTCLIQQQQAAATRDILELFERTLAAHEEQLRQLREENERQRKQLDALLQPQVRLERAVLPQQLLVSKEEVPPEQQECSPSVEQEEPEPPHIKEEQEELNITKDIPFTPAPVKSKDDEERVQSSQLHQSQTEENREAEPPASSSIETEADEEDLQASSDGQLLSSHSSKSETEDMEDDLEETGEPQSGLASVSEVLFSHDRSEAGEKPSSCSMNREKPFSCSVCAKRFRHKTHLNRHMKVHKKEKPFSCPFCAKRFTWKSELSTHMRVHTGEKPFSCSICGNSFTLKSVLNKHMSIHTGEKPFSCSICGISFRQKYNLSAHMSIHTGEKPFSCSVCGKSFRKKCSLNIHMSVHSREKT
ncbi:gastrula zinc finger protein XlCGF53.1-like [Myripristis murdjan]|uniref:gastrula zinc finger protein XlCGF53.1-like n=1 Tax=Myripristis murdjan TaxID=586833 RepID=UPI001176174B|nr:gastrula zinc finger protein XlCGF53.1-like [Myripristis murdjan]